MNLTEIEILYLKTKHFTIKEFEEWLDDVKQEASNEGYSDGHSAGYDTGHAEGYEVGRLDND